MKILIKNTDTDHINSIFENIATFYNIEWNNYSFLIQSFCDFCSKMGYHYVGEYENEEDLTVIDGLLINIAMEIIPKISIFNLSEQHGKIFDIYHTKEEKSTIDGKVSGDSTSWSANEQYPSPVNTVDIKVITSPTSKGGGGGTSETSENRTNTVEAKESDPEKINSYIKTDTFIIWNVFFNSIKRIVNEYVQIL